MQLSKSKIYSEKSDEEKYVVLQVAKLKYDTSDAKNFLAVDLTRTFFVHLFTSQITNYL